MAKLLLTTEERSASMGGKSESVGIDVENDSSVDAELQMDLVRGDDTTTRLE